MRLQAAFAGEIIRAALSLNQLKECRAHALLAVSPSLSGRFGTESEIGL